MIVRSRGESRSRAAAHGASLAFTYQGEALKTGPPLGAECECASGSSQRCERRRLHRSMFQEIGKVWNRLDSVVHAIALG